MMETAKTIGLLTSGGDAPGMNAAIRAIVRSGIRHGFQMKGIRRGYHGLLKEEIIDMNSASVSDIIQRGGTVLGTARSKGMMTSEGQDRAAYILQKNGIDVLIVIGGDGSLAGAASIAKRGIDVIGIPGTIDLDVGCTDYTIGFDTAVNTAMEALDKIRDTSASHERVSIIEVMGRGAGYIALWTGLAGGAEEVLTPETYHGNEQLLMDHIIENRALGKRHHIIVNAEGIGHSEELAKRIEKVTDIETRATILGYLQRGGSPTCRDRVEATIMGEKAIELICQNKLNRVVAKKGNQYTDVDIFEAQKMKKTVENAVYMDCRKLVRS